MRWIGYAAGALAGAFLLNLVAWSLLLYGLEYNASSFRHAVADVGVIILYPATAFPYRARWTRSLRAPLLGEL